MPKRPRLSSKKLAKFLIALYYIPILFFAVTSCQGSQQPQVIKETITAQDEKGEEVKGLHSQKAESHILCFDTGRVQADVEETPKEPPIKLLEKADNRATFESSALWCWTLPVLMKDGQYTMLRLPGGGVGGEIGEPELPYYGKFIRVPDGVKVRLIVDEVNWVKLEGKYDVAPRQPAPPDIAEAPEPEFRKNVDVYARDAFIPSQPVRIAERMRIRRQAFIYVVYTPVAYNPARRALKAARRIEWHLEYSAP